MTNYAELAIQAASDSSATYCKFITPNDTGATGAHQAGYYIHKNSFRIAFDSPAERGANKERFVTIRWQDQFETRSTFKYYGVGTRDEYRLTRTTAGNPFHDDKYIGSLMVLSRATHDAYTAYVLESDDEIDAFLEHFGLSPVQIPNLIENVAAVAQPERSAYAEYIEKFQGEFPTTSAMAQAAQEIHQEIHDTTLQDMLEKPDKILTEWIEIEFSLFKELENSHYRTLMTSLTNVEELIDLSNSILNRRKARAGKSLEHHLAKLFDVNRIAYSAQKRTEGNKKPDFIFPDITSYKNKVYDPAKLTFLGAKTTCKDRWRQVLNEADRIPHKHLMTLQQGVTASQLNEMKTHNLTLVVPEQYHGSYPPEHRDELLTLKEFMNIVAEKNPR